MNHFSSAFTVSLTLLALSHQQAAAQTRDRSQVDPKYQWQLEDIYPTLVAWTQAKETLAGEFDAVLQYKGQLTKSAGQLVDCLEYGTRLSKELTFLSSGGSDYPINILKKCRRGHDSGRAL